MKLKKLISLFLASMVFLGMVGCAKDDGQTVNVKDLYVPTYEDTYEMMLRSDLSPDVCNKEQLLLYKECGFNTIPLLPEWVGMAPNDVAPYVEEYEKYEQALEDWDGNEETKPVEPTKPNFIKGLELCEEVGLDVFIRYHCVTYVSKDPTDEPNYFEKFLYNLDLRKYPAVKGFMIADEPTYGQVNDIVDRYLPWFNENYGGEGYEFFVNLNGAESTAWRDKYSSGLFHEDLVKHYYEDVLDKADSINKTLSFDTYVLHSDGTNNYVHDSFLHSALAMRKHANKYDTGLGAYIQCFTGYSTLRDLTSYADFSFQVYTYLSFGANRLSYYGYRDYSTEKHLVEGGEPRDKWYWAQHSMDVCKKLDGILANFEWNGIYTNVGSKSFFSENEAFERIEKDSLKKLNGVKSFKSNYDAIVGQFEDANGNDAFMLVNYEEPSIKHNNKVTMTFDKADGVMYYRDGDPYVVGLKNKTFTVDLEPGEGVFIIPLYKK